MLFEQFKKIHINHQGEMLSFSPDKDPPCQSCPELQKAFDLAQRYNRLMAELASFYEESDHIYFE